MASLHDLGLVRHEVELDADREALLQALGGLVQVLAESEIVAAVAHGDADADRGLAVDAEHLGAAGRYSRADLGDVGKLVEAPVDQRLSLRNACPAASSEPVTSTSMFSWAC